MELNEVTQKLPPHLLQFVVDQPYNSYTPIDQAVWRYVMRQNYHHLKNIAHESYVEGLRKTGVEIDNIPTMYGMNRILKEIGWAAVAVDGFIPPGAFMEFTKYNVLVIAADIRTIDHIEYTPAPDIIHESAGHAPIIAEPEFAEYLKYIGEVGSKAFSSKKDYELYEAIRHLSIIKEDPNTPQMEIEEAEKEINQIQSNMGEPSEMALIRNLHWWTVEYGLIGTVDHYKLYGAGLLSSIGESKSCFNCDVKKIPYSIDAAHVNYDITKPQPQLFVTPDFKHLRVVLDQFIETMAWKTGGIQGIKKAISSENVGTIELSSGIQVSATFNEVIEDEKGNPVFVKANGSVAIALNNKELKGFDKNRFQQGFSSPLGNWLAIKKPVESLSEVELKELTIIENEKASIVYDSGLKAEGKVRKIHRSDQGELILIELDNAIVEYRNKIIAELPECVLLIGEKVSSVFSGAADIEAFQPTATVPRETTHKIVYDEKTVALQKLYGQVRFSRESKTNFSQLPLIWKTILEGYPKEWLLPLEILEIFEKNSIYPTIVAEIKNYLEQKKASEPQLRKLIENGLELLTKSEGSIF
jgi:phenylalanine-4-hydroxylase